MADKILHGIEMPVCVGYGTEANLEDTTGKCYLGELALSTDTAILFACPATGDAMIPVVEQWRGSPTFTDTAPTAGQSKYRLTLQETAPSNAFSIRFKNPGGSDVDFWLVLEEAS